MEAVLDLATDIACHAEAGLARILGTRAARVRERVGRAGALRLGSVHLHASPSSVPMVAGGTARHIRHSLEGIPSDMNAEGRAGNVTDDEVEGAARRHGAEGRRRSPAGATSSARTRRGARGLSLRRRSWRGWPAPAHSPIRPPPSTRRDLPADDVAH